MLTMLALLQEVAPAAGAGYGLLGAAGAGVALTGVLLYFELGKKSESNFKPIAGLRALSPFFVARSY